MKRIFSLIIISILLASQLRVSFIIVEFYLNRQAITLEFCVNLPKGDTLCQGKCHLKRTLGKEKKKGATNPEIIVEERVPLFFQTIGFSYIKQKIVKADAKVYHEPLYDFIFIDSTFHPPEST